MRSPRLLAPLLAALLGFAAAAAADPLVLRSGSLVTPWTGDPFQARLLADGVDLRIFTRETGITERLYQPGDVVPLVYRARLDVELTGSFTGPGSIDFRFTGPSFTIPPGPISTTDYVDIPYRLPFSFVGEVVGFTGTEPGYTQQFIGSGIAGFTISSYPYYPVGYLHDAYFFRFTDPAPVPEPATLLLTSAGVLLAARRARQGRRVRRG